MQSLHSCQPRFLHPKELAVLLTVSPRAVTNQGPRSSNCLLGLVAAPLQSLWVFSHLITGASKHIPTLGQIEPLKVIQAYKQEITAQARLEVCSAPQAPLQLTIATSDGADILLTSPHSATIAQFLQAEKITLDWGTAQFLKEGALNLPDELGLLAISQADTQLVRQTKRQRTSRPQDELTIALVHAGMYYMAFVPAGSFLFEALRQLHIEANWLTNEDGKLFGADTRVWHSQRYYVLDDQTFPTLKRTAACGHNTPATMHKGLSELAINTALASIHKHFASTDRTQPLLLPAIWLDDTSKIQDSHSPYWLQMAFQYSNGTLYIPCVDQGHWVLLRAQILIDGLHWTIYDGLRHATTQAQSRLMQRVTSTLKTNIAEIHRHTYIQQQDDYSCGTIVIANFCKSLGLFGEFQNSHIQQLHAHLWRHDHSTGPRARGPQQAETGALAQLLTTKGVPAQHAPERAQAAIQKLGIKAIQNALASKNAWQCLKAEASKPGKAFKFVLPDQLGEYIAQRAQERYGADGQYKQKKKQKHSKPAKPEGQLVIDPQLLELLTGHFVDQDGEEVPRITIAEVVPDATGIALCTLQAAQPYLADSKKLSTDPLALLITDDTQGLDLGYADAHTIQFAAKLTATKDPLLLTGILVQLGDQEVQQQQTEDPMKGIDVLDTSILKITIFKDELVDWTPVTQAPVRFLQQQIPLLLLCKKQCSGAQCQFFHQPVEEEASSVIHEVYGRRYSTLQGHTTSSDKAEQYAVFIRVSTSVLKELLPICIPGIYIEPRDTQQRTSHPDYVVQWLSDTNRETAVHKLRTITGALALTRLKHRYGLRVLNTQAKQVHAQLHPDTDYIQLNIIKKWKIHPLPHGLTRPTVQRLMKEWSWTAKALQPMKGDNSGGSWEVGSEEDPPQPVLPAFGRDVLITLLREKQTTVPTSTQIVPLKAKRFLQNQPASSSNQNPAATKMDPWQLPGQDPWQKPIYKTNSPVQQRLAAVTEQMKDEVTKQVKEQTKSQGVTSEHMQTYQQGTEARLTAMESNLKELQTQNTKMQSWFQEAGTRIAATEHQLQNINTTLEQQQQDLQGVKTEVKTTLEQTANNFQQAMQGLRQDIGTDFDERMDKMMARIESNAEKRARH